LLHDGADEFMHHMGMGPPWPPPWVKDRWESLALYTVLVVYLPISGGRKWA
jgi:hypothetical protein